MRINIKTLATLALVVLMVACKTPQNVTYFQDTDINPSTKLQTEQVFKLQPEDKINIFVSSKDQALSQLFTLSSVGQRNNSGGSSYSSLSSTTNNQYTIGYTVDQSGNIDFPVIGTIHAAGMTRMELAKDIKQKLVSQKLVLDPVVTVEYLNMGVSVLGEVSKPGRITIAKDHCTILDAIAQAGDLTISGMRDSIKVLRTVNGSLKTYNVNLCNIESVASSPVYYLQQEDIVYVSPTDKRKRETTVNGNTVLTPSFWISVASLLTTITALAIR